MARRNITKIGQLNLGKVIDRALAEQGWNQKILLEKVSGRGHVSNKDRISRLINASAPVDAALVLVIADLEICKNPSTGMPYSFRDLMLIACEAIDSDTGLPVEDEAKTRGD